MLTLYSMQSSGNSYKVRMLLARLGLRYHLRELDIFKGETRTPEYLAKNPDGHVPLLELPDGYLLPESNAILVYLAEGSPYLPADRLARAEVLRWMFFEQHSHEPAIAAARYWLRLVRRGAAASCALHRPDARRRAGAGLMGVGPGRAAIPPPADHGVVVICGDLAVGRLIRLNHVAKCFHLGHSRRRLVGVRVLDPGARSASPRLPAAPPAR